MKLLIITQAVDRNHPILGFFHRWVEEFAKHFEHIHVIALQQGTSDLPGNVTVYSLGKEQGVQRFARTAKFLSYMIRIRNEYDAVFVHMNPEYVVLAGWWWRLTGKKIGLWYTHKSVDVKLRFATVFADVIFTASPESFRLRTSKLQIMGHGIDTDFFTPDPSVSRDRHFLSVGRLMTSKRHDRAIHEAHKTGVGLRVVGDGPERGALLALAQELGADVAFLGALTQEKLRDEYRTAAKLIHRSETGSLDKVVLEAAACGLVVDSSDSAISVLPLSPSYIREHHSLPHLVSAISDKLK